MKTKATFHPGKVTLFLLLGAADLVLTWRLLHGSGGRVYESNPIAGAWLEAYGWSGLIVFKALAMSLVLLSALYVSYRRPRTGGRLLGFGCLTTLGVVVYSVVLLIRPLPPTSLADDDEAAERQTQRLNRQLQREKDYGALLARLGKTLVAGQASLAEAVDRLAESEKAHDPRWLQHLHEHYRADSDPQCLALHLSVYTLSHYRDAGGHWPSLARELDSALKHQFGWSVPLEQTPGFAETSAEGSQRMAKVPSPQPVLTGGTTLPPLPRQREQAISTAADSGPFLEPSRPDGSGPGSP